MFGQYKVNNYKFYCVLMISKQRNARVCSIFTDAGRPLKYEEYATSGQKRHFWENPTKNYGFYTSEQMEQQSRRIKTEGLYETPSRYTPKNGGNFLVNSLNPEEVHCCTCHNNPQRYIKNSQRCKFCEKHSKYTIVSPLSKNTLEKSKRDSTTIQKQGLDRGIQVSLPRVHRHTEKHDERCFACIEKRKNRVSLNSNVLQHSAKRMLARQLQGSKASLSRRGRIPSNLQI